MIMADVHLLLLLFINIIISKKQYYSNILAHFFSCNVHIRIKILICIAFITNYWLNRLLKTAKILLKNAKIS